MSLIQDSFTRMRAGSFNTYNLTNIDEWICKNTKINEKPFSFKDREFQIPIIRDTAKTQVVVKCAQVGLSELSYRWAVATCCIQKNWTNIYTFPTATDAQDNCRTRIDPMIEGSDELARLVSADLNNSAIKQFGKNSFLYFKGTMNERAALSTPADAVIHDEVDKSDMDVVTTYVSRLQDKEAKIRKLFSTPTLDGYGISKEARTANRYRHLVKCRCCNHVFLPDYYSHIVIPGWNKAMEEITKDNLHTVRWEEATLKCPKCDRDPDMHHTRMPWVVENPDLNYHANAWFVSPFSAHKRILVPTLVKNSTEYKKISEFKNQALGLTAEEKNESITADDIDKAQGQNILPSAELHQIGVDLGLMCNVTVGRETSTGELLVVHRERVPYMKVEARVAELRIQYRVTVSVLDSQPYSDIVNRVCEANHNSWGAVFVTSKNPLAFTAKEEEPEKEEGKMGFRVINVNRNPALDELLALIKAGKLIVAASDQNEIFKKQMLSLKRVQKFTQQGELTYIWVKTGDEEDHYHFSLLYLYIATRMRHTAGAPGLASTTMPALRVIRKKVRR